MNTTPCAPPPGCLTFPTWAKSSCAAAPPPQFLNRVLTNDIRKLQGRQGQYTLMCNERGGAIDDLYVYQVQAEEFLLIVNASRTGADAAWLNAQLAAFPQRADVDLKNLSADFGALALQGPKDRPIH